MTVKKIIGKKLKDTRLKNDLTIQEVSLKSGVSSNMISRIERGLTTPSVEILMKLAESFGMSISYFVEEAEKGRGVVHTRKGQGEPIFFFEDKHQIVSLSHGIVDPGFTVFLDTIEEGCNSGDGFMVHKGEEFAYVIEGRLRFIVDDVEFVLEKGDSLTFKAPLPHRWENIFDGQTVVMWVVSPAPTISQ